MCYAVCENVHQVKYIFFYLLFFVINVWILCINEHILQNICLDIFYLSSSLCPSSFQRQLLFWASLKNLVLFLWINNPIQTHIHFSLCFNVFCVNICLQLELEKDYSLLYINSKVCCQNVLLNHLHTGPVFLQWEWAENLTALREKKGGRYDSCAWKLIY